MWNVSEFRARGRLLMRQAIDQAVASVGVRVGVGIVFVLNAASISACSPQLIGDVSKLKRDLNAAPLVVAGPPHASQSLIESIESTVVADGVQTATVRVYLRDENGIPVVGEVPTFSATDTGTTNVYGACSATNIAGASFCTLQSTKAETKTLSLLTPIALLGGTVGFVHGPAAKLAFVGTIPETKVNVALNPQPQVRVLDAFDNVVTTGADAAVSVSLTLQSGTGSVSGTTAETGVSGVSDFSGNSVALTTLGNKVLRASANLSGPGNVTVDSNSFVIVPITCSSGTLATTCSVTSAETIADGVTISGTNLVLEPGASISNATPKQTYSISLTGDLVVKNTATITGNVAITAVNVDVQTGGVISANGLGNRGAFRNGYNATTGEGPGGGVAAGVASDYAAGGGGYGGAGGHGSEVGTSGGASYGSSSNPTDFGSGGGSINSGYPGGNGGGRITIAATGVLTVNGTVRAEGEAPASGTWYRGSGGGSGGTLHLTAMSVAGVGTLSAGGGDGFHYHYDPDYRSGGGGSGGRIFLQSANPFAGTVSVADGTTRGDRLMVAPEKGTYHLALTTGLDGLCDSGSLSTTCIVSTKKVLGTNQTSITGSGNLTIQSTGSWYAALQTVPITIDIDGDLTLAGQIDANLHRLEAANVTIASTGKIIGNVGSASGAGLVATNVTIADGAFVDASGFGHPGGFNHSDRGFCRSLRTGAGPGGGGWDLGPPDGFGGGGGHASAGGSGTGAAATGGASYGVAVDPVTHGSGGGGGFNYSYDRGGAGGGLIKFQVSGTLTHNGVIMARGISGGAANQGASNGAGGAGGSINLKVGAFAGTTGRLIANGGTGFYSYPTFRASGSGSGGYVYVESGNWPAPTVEVFGGRAMEAASATNRQGGRGVYHLVTPNGWADLCDSGTLATTCTISSPKVLSHNLTTLSATGSIVVSSTIRTPSLPDTFYDLDIDGNFTISPSASVQMSVGTGTIDGALTIGNGINNTDWSGNFGSEDTVSHSGLTVGSLNVTTNGTISATGLGHKGGNLSAEHEFGPTASSDRVRRGGFAPFVHGSGQSPGLFGGVMYVQWVGGGGSHGGLGGAGSHADADGGLITYGSDLAPVTFGSGGGGSGNPYRRGGSGGGLIRLSVLGSAQISGTLRSNGDAGIASGIDAGGGGAGGSIYVTANAFSGGGTVSAAGGAGGVATAFGGGGGGGRIALIRSVGGAFSGTLSVSGGTAGAGAVPGAPGTTYQNP